MNRRLWCRRAAGALTIVLGALAATLPATALEDQVTKADCKGEVWRGLVDSAGASFTSRGQCVVAARQGDAYTEPRFVTAAATLSSPFTLGITFTEIGMLPGDVRDYQAFATVTYTDVCRPIGDFTAPGVTRSAPGNLGGSLTATADDSGHVAGAFDARLVSGGTACEPWEMGSRGGELQTAVDSVVVVDMTGSIVHPI